MAESEAEVTEGSQISWKSQESLGHSVEDIPKDELLEESSSNLHWFYRLGVGDIWISVL